MEHNDVDLEPNVTEDLNQDFQCAICGHKPARMNFGAISCSSCKMFFRRHEFYNLVS